MPDFVVALADTAVTMKADMRDQIGEPLAGTPGGLSDAAL